MPTLAGTYDVSVRFLRWASPLLEGGSSKIAVGIRGRIDAHRVLSEWAQLHRERARSLVWMHAPSVGEGLQARSALEVLLEHRPDLQAAYTFFSPSAVELGRRMPVDVAGYLPWDVHEEMLGLVGELDPGLIAFTKTEVWPGLTRAAVGRDIPVMLIAATLPPGARRLRPSARALLRPTFGVLSGVLAISDEDGERFLRLGVPEDRIEVTGDPGIDSAWQRARQVSSEARHLAPFLADPRPTVVAGSTWRPDESVLVPALGEIRERRADPRVVIAPHEPHAEAIADLEGLLVRHGFRAGRLAEVEARGRAGDTDAIIVDRVGILAQLYTVGAIAFVGGGFGSDGLHSVLEPAAAGVPVLFGPRHGNSRAAGELVRVGGATCVADGRAIVQAVGGWLQDPRMREEAGRRAAGYIEGHRGAARRTAHAIVTHLPTVNGAAR